MHTKHVSKAQFVLIRLVENLSLGYRWDLLAHTYMELFSFKPAFSNAGAGSNGLVQYKLVFLPQNQRH